MWTIEELKVRGKAAFKANFWKCVLVAFLLTAFVLGTAASSGSGWRQNYSGNVNVTTQDGHLVVNGQSYDTVQEAITAAGEAANAKPEEIETINNFVTQVQNDPEAREALGLVAAAVGGALLIIALVASLLHLFVFNPLEVGCRGFFARNSARPAELDEIGCGFHPYWRSVGAMFLRDLFTALWTLLFIVPGIIKHYSYRMVPYILADEPGISGREAITLSRQMMDGQKWRAFVLDLSFIGWDILSALTLGILGLFYVNPYKFATDAELYHELSKHY